MKCTAAFSYASFISGTLSNQMSDPKSTCTCGDLPLHPCAVLLQFFTSSLTRPGIVSVP